MQPNRATQQLRCGGASRSYRWIVQENSLLLMPPSPKPSFKWSYLVSRTLLRLNPANLLY